MHGDLNTTAAMSLAQGTKRCQATSSSCVPAWREHQGEPLTAWLCMASMSGW